MLPTSTRRASYQQYSFRCACSRFLFVPAYCCLTLCSFRSLLLHAASAEASTTCQRRLRELTGAMRRSNEALGSSYLARKEAAVKAAVQRYVASETAPLPQSPEAAATAATAAVVAAPGMEGGARRPKAQAAAEAAEAAEAALLPYPSGPSAGCVSVLQLLNSIHNEALAYSPSERPTGWGSVNVCSCPGTHRGLVLQRDAAGCVTKYWCTKHVGSYLTCRSAQGPSVLPAPLSAHLPTVCLCQTSFCLPSPSTSSPTPTPQPTNQPTTYPLPPRPGNLRPFMVALAEHLVEHLGKAYSTLAAAGASAKASSSGASGGVRVEQLLQLWADLQFLAAALRPLLSEGLADELEEGKVRGGRERDWTKREECVVVVGVVARAICHAASRR